MFSPVLTVIHSSTLGGERQVRETDDSPMKYVGDRMPNDLLIMTMHVLFCLADNAVPDND
jgi:hypothetical protein